VVGNFVTNLIYSQFLQLQDFISLAIHAINILQSDKTAVYCILLIFPRRFLVSNSNKLYYCEYWHFHSRFRSHVIDFMVLYREGY